MGTHTKTIAIVASIIIGLFLLLRFAGGYFVSTISPNIEISKDQNKTESGKAVVGEGAPYFSLPSSTGGSIDLASLSGFPIVLTFWSTWNNESADQIKIFDDYITENQSYLKDTNLRFVTIDSQENQSAVENFIRRGGYDITVLVDESGETSNNYGIKTLPTTFFIDKVGIVTEIFVGTLSEKMLVDKMEKILR